MSALFIKHLGLVAFPITLFVSTAAAKPAEPDASEIIAEVRAIVCNPDKWADMAVELQALDSLAMRCQQDMKTTVMKFRLRLASYSTYYSAHPFTLSAEEKTALARIVHAYDSVFEGERERILMLMREHPDQYRNAAPASMPYWREGDTELLKCWPIFKKHCSSDSQLLKLAGNYMEITRAYGRLLNQIRVESVLYLN